MTSSNGRLTSSPRVYGTTQNEQYLLQPSMIETNAVGPSARGSGRASNFSISGNEMSTCGLRSARSRLTISGSRCSVCGPNTRSTYGARLTIASPSWLATQPPTPMTRPGLAFFSRFQRPSWLNTLSCAFSRIAQVLTRITSASDSSSVSVMPSLAASTSAIFDESYSFIWQPWVLMNNLPAMTRTRNNRKGAHCRADRVNGRLGRRVWTTLREGERQIFVRKERKGRKGSFHWASRPTNDIGAVNALLASRCVRCGQIS